METTQASPNAPTAPSAATPMSNLSTTIAQAYADTITTPLAPVLPPNLFQEFESFAEALVLEQLRKPEDLLKLNPSRRESLGRFLSELCRLPESDSPQEMLKAFTRMDRTEAEHEALKQLFKQIAFVQIAKALLLKSWSCHQKIPLLKADLKDLTAAVERGLRSYIHLQTSSCQLIQRNFYSWYKLDQKMQDKLWNLLEKITNLPAMKSWLLESAMTLSADTLGERDRYSQGFYQNLWNAVKKHKIFEPRTNECFAFSPTLRDGSLMESAPESLEWIGFESLSFELLFCEIRYFWEQPKEPPLWIKGNSLEMSMEQQSSMLLTHSGKQNILQQMDAISSCEIALIAEENLIRTQSRSLAAQSLRKQVDQHAILKKMKQPTTTRGTYQACQALEKLRQGGILIWAREELLNETSGKPALQFILSQAKIALIADFSALNCECCASKRNLPKALYILRKENQLETRKSHRPLMVKAFGTLKGQTEVSMLFDRVLSLVQKPDQSFPLEPFQLHARVSPMDQREWEQHWFNPTDDHLVDRIEELKRNSTPLGQFAAVRTFHHGLGHDFGAEPTLFPTENNLDSGFYVWLESNKNGSEVHTCHPRMLPKYLEKSHTLFFVTPVQPRYSIPLQVILKSQHTRDWLNYSVERKKGAWVIREADLKSVPIPFHISKQMMEPIAHDSFPANIQAILNQIPTEPGIALKQLENVQDEVVTSSHEPASMIPAHVIRSEAFLLASHVLHHLEDHQAMLFSLVTPEEQVAYPKLFQSVMTDTDLVRIDQHPLVRFTPTLLPHQAITQIQTVKVPTPGILLVTKQGMSQQLYIQDQWLRERCMELIFELQTRILEPTWTEITKNIKLPRNPAQAQTMSMQILKAYSDEKLKRKELTHLIGACLSGHRNSQNKVGMLQ